VLPTHFRGYGASAFRRSDATNQGDADLPANEEPTGRAAVLGHSKLETTVRYLGSSWMTPWRSRSKPKSEPRLAVRHHSECRSMAGLGSPKVMLSCEAIRASA